MKTLHRLALGAALPAALLATAPGCGNDDSSDGPSTRAVTLDFDGRVGNERFTCGETYGGLGASSDQSMTVDDYRLYVNGIELVRGDGARVPLAFDQDGEWQHDDLALLDFEDGCAAGTPETNLRVSGTVPAGSYTGVCFQLGVPFEMNHVSDATTVSPLNASGMLWSWTTGRKFLRIDGVGDPAGSATSWNVHLGSTGCVDAGGGPEPEEACAFPNRPTVCLDDFDPDVDTIVADLGALLSGSDLSVDAAGAPGCMSGNDDPECIAVMPRLGLDFSFRAADGSTQDYPASQSFFHAHHGDHTH